MTKDPIKIAFIPLGCSKNTVDCEQMLFLLEQAGMQNVVQPEEAHVVLVNTCGFIESAKEEAIANILEMAALKKEGKIQKIVVTGCLAERYSAQIAAELPEVDAIVASSALGQIVDGVLGALAGTHPLLQGDKNAPVPERQRVLSTPFYTAFVKISEGCDNHCTYCAIPGIKGVLRSRTPDAIEAECRKLAAQGVRELVLVAQDTTRYGADLFGKPALDALLPRLCAIEGIVWIRLHYLYPDGLSDELLDVIAAEDKIVKYFDIPMQHADDEILAAMGRRYTRRDLAALIDKVRAKMPSSVIRTSIIVGFPGETEEKFAALCAFLKEARLPRVGAFAYSAEEGTKAAALANQVDEQTKADRLAALYTLQDTIMEAHSRNSIGDTLWVLNEGLDALCEVYVGRTAFDAPEVDGKIFFRSSKPIKPGEFVKVFVEDCVDTDLVGRAAEETQPVR